MCVLPTRIGMRRRYLFEYAVFSHDSKFECIRRICTTLTLTVSPLVHTHKITALSSSSSHAGVASTQRPNNHIYDTGVPVAEAQPRPPHMLCSFAVIFIGLIYHIYTNSR